MFPEVRSAIQREHAGIFSELVFYRALAARGAQRPLSAEAKQIVKIDIPQILSDIRSSGMTSADSSGLSSYSQFALAWLSGPESSFFDTAFADFLPGVLREQWAIGSSVVGATVAPGQAKPVVRMSFSGDALEAELVGALAVASAELLKFNPGLGALDAELRKAVRSATDAYALGKLTSGAPAIASLGNEAFEIRMQIRQGLDALGIGANSRLHLVLPAAVVARLAIMSTDDGAAAFPDLTAAGGQLGPLTVHPSDGLTSTGLLFDGSAFTAAALPIDVSLAQHASVEMVSPLTNSTGTGSPAEAVESTLVSMFQVDGICLRAERYLGLMPVRSGGAAVLSGAGDWALIGSPPA